MADLVTVDWLANNLNSNVKILDCTWVMPGENTDLPAGYIAGAQYFDIDEIADKASPMTHMLPSENEFSKAISAMGIENSSHVICYDRHGVRAAPRVWWTFKTFGHDKVSVLDGGLPTWIKAGHSLLDVAHTSQSTSQYQIQPAKLKVTDIPGVTKAIDADIQIVDARSSGLFYGTMPEPRAGLRSGRIPGSFSLPFGELIGRDGKFLPLTVLAKYVGEAGINLDKPIITSCGSGVTAAGIAHVLHRLGAKDITLYDGSWVEWGASNFPVEI